MSHEIPSSHTPIEPFNPVPIPGESHMTTRYSDGSTRTYIFGGRPRMPVVEYGEKKAPTQVKIDFTKNPVTRVVINGTVDPVTKTETIAGAVTFQTQAGYMYEVAPDKLATGELPPEIDAITDVLYRGINLKGETVFQLEHVTKP